MQGDHIQALGKIYSGQVDGCPPRIIRVGTVCGCPIFPLTRASRFYRQELNSLPTRAGDAVVRLPRQLTLTAYQSLLVSARVYPRFCIFEMCSEVQILLSASHALANVRNDIVVMTLLTEGRTRDDHVKRSSQWEVSSM